MRINTSNWQTLCWGLDGTVHNLTLYEELLKNEEWLWHKAHAAELNRMIQNMVGLIEEHLVKMESIEIRTEHALKEKGKL